MGFKASAHAEARFWLANKSHDTRVIQLAIAICSTRCVTPKIADKLKNFWR